jgi:hypothetical protein
LIADVFSHHLAVFRFNETIIIFAVRTATGKLDKVFGTDSQELVVDKLTAIIAVNAEQGEWAVQYGRWRYVP